jgi:hypothetical protein
VSVCMQVAQKCVRVQVAQECECVHAGGAGM